MATNETKKAATEAAGTLAELLKQLGEEKQRSKDLAAAVQGLVGFIEAKLLGTDRRTSVYRQGRIQIHAARIALNKAGL